MKAKQIKEEWQFSILWPNEAFLTKSGVSHANKQVFYHFYFSKHFRTDLLGKIGVTCDRLLFAEKP